MENVILDPKIFNNEEMLVDNKRNIYIYGKNGTGKSTISNLIKEQNQEEFDIRLFNGFESIVSGNKELKSISLGEKNVSIQKEIDKKIKEQNEQEIKTADFLKELKECNYNLDSTNSKLENFYKKSAKDIKDSLQIMNYDKRNFQDDIALAKQLSEDDISIYKKTIENKALTKKVYTPININLNKTVEDINNLLQTSIVQNVVDIKFKNNNEQNWVENGIKIHNDSDEHNKCIFCGNNISSERWQSLNNYFNEQVNDLEYKITYFEEILKKSKEYVDNIPKYNNSDFYPIFQKDLNKINNQIFDFKISLKKILEELSDHLEKKKSNIFSTIDKYEITLAIPNPTDINNEIKKLIDKNNEYGGDIQAKKDDAQNQLKYNEVYNKIDASSYTDLQNKLNIYKNEKNKLNSKYRSEEEKLINIQKEIIELKSKTISEEIAVSIINEKLKQCGNSSFKLVNIKDENQQGQYVVQDANSNEQRGIDELSTGEKNIVASLWFINSLEDVLNASNKKKIIIFDDPMNSNDDTYQYLIISEIEKLLYLDVKKNDENKSDIQNLFVLTHNVHFYVNIIEHKEKEKNISYHLNKINGKTSLKRIPKKGDIKSRYDVLWEELRWLYDKNKPDLMFNPIRRILETYFSFNNLDFNKELMKNNFTLYRHLNVSSHFLDDELTNITPDSRDDIINSLERLFKNCGGEEHFDNRWKKE